MWLTSAFPPGLKRKKPYRFFFKKKKRFLKIAPLYFSNNYFNRFLDKSLYNKINVFSYYQKHYFPLNMWDFFSVINNSPNGQTPAQCPSVPSNPDIIYRELTGITSHSLRAQSHKTAPFQTPIIRPGSQYFLLPATNQRERKTASSHEASLAELYTGWYVWKIGEKQIIVNYIQNSY